MSAQVTSQSQVIFLTVHTDFSPSDHFSEVVIVEPETLFNEAGDVLPQTTKRKRVVQYQTLHGFQPVNLQVLRRLFPTFDQEVTALGARILPTEYNAHVRGIQILSPEVSSQVVQG